MATFLNDTFTGSAGTALTSHTGELGATWTYHTTAYPSSNIVITDANRIRSNNTSVALAYASGTPASADYAVTGTLRRVGTLTGLAGVAGRINTAANTLYYGIHNTTGNEWQIYKNVAGAATRLGGYAQTLTDATDYTVTLEMAGTSLKLYVNGVLRVSVTDSSISAAGRVGCILFGSSAPSNTNGYHLGDIADAPIAALSATATFVSATDTSISVSVAAIGGVSPLTYQWYRSTTANFTPGGGNILSGATSTSLTDSSSLSAGVMYWYKCVVTDAASTTATTVPISATLWAATLKLGFIGDSITNGFGTTLKPGTICAEYLERLGRLRVCTATNYGVNGADSVDYISGSANLIAAKSAFSSAGVTHVVITLGTNDTAGAVSNATYLSNMTSCVNDLVTAGYVVILNNPPGYEPGSTVGYGNAQVDRLVGYATQLDSLVNGTTILRGDKLALAYFSGFNNELVGDGVHFTDTGNEHLAALWAFAIDAALNPSGSGPGTGSIAVSARTFSPIASW